MKIGHSPESKSSPAKRRKVEEQLPELPHEIWKVIFYYLPIKDLNQIGSLNRTSNTLINEVKNEEYDSLWKKLRTNASPHSSVSNLHSMYTELYQHTPYSLEMKRILLHYSKSLFNKTTDHLIIEMLALMRFHNMPLPVEYIKEEIGTKGFYKIKSLALTYAVQYNDRDAFDSILRDNNIFIGTSIESIDAPKHFTKGEALKVAFRKGHLDMVNVILRDGSVLKEKGILGEALLLAVKNGFTEITEVLLAIPQITDIDSCTKYSSVKYANKNNDDVILEKLLDRFSHSLEEILQYRVDADIGIVDKILSRNHLDISDKIQVNCFSNAVHANNHAVLERLLRSFSISDHEKILLREKAEMKGYAEIVALLSDSPAQTLDPLPLPVTYAFNTPTKTEDLPSKVEEVEPSFCSRRVAM